MATSHVVSYLDTCLLTRKTDFARSGVLPLECYQSQLARYLNWWSGDLETRRCEFKSRSRQRIFRCHISEDCSKIDYLLGLSLVMKTFESNRYLIKVPMTRKFLLHDVKEYLKLQYKFVYTFALQRFVDEIFRFEFFVLSANYVTICIMSCC